MIKTKKTYQAKIKQGDILKNIEFIESIEEKDGKLEIRKIMPMLPHRTLLMD